MRVLRMTRISVALIVATCFLLSLSACGKGGSGSNVSETASGADTVWQVRHSAEENEIKRYVEEALVAADDARSFIPETEYQENIKDNVASGFYDEMFDNGNALYHEGDYSEAEEYYSIVIADLPTHLGANNNLTLALLQQGRNDEAILQALKTLALYPEELGCLLNVQTAADACGFHPDATNDASDLVLQEGSYPSVSSALASDVELGDGNGGRISSAYAYNLIYSLIDFQMDPSASIESEYQNLRSEILDLSLYQKGDPDADALRGYLDGVAALNDLHVAASDS